MSIYTHTYQVKETEVPIIIPDEKNKSEISSKKNLKNRLTTGTVALLAVEIGRASCRERV